MCVYPVHVYVYVCVQELLLQVVMGIPSYHQHSLLLEELSETVLLRAPLPGRTLDA